MLKLNVIALAIIALGLLLSVTGYSEGINHYGFFDALALACPGMGMAMAGFLNLLAKRSY